MTRFLLTVLICFSSLSAQAQIPFPFSWWTPRGSSPQPGILWWKLNEGSGTVMADSSIGNHSGTNNATWITGKSGSGSALNFPGTNANSSTATAVTYATNMVTVTFWMLSNSTNTTQVLLEVGNTNFAVIDHSFAVFIDTLGITGSVKGTGSGWRSESYGIVGLGAWNHWVLVFDNSSNGGNIRMFKNGVEVTTSLTNNTKAGNGTLIATQRLFVGARALPEIFLNGRIDDFRIYAGDQSSSAAQIMADSQ